MSLLSNGKNIWYAHPSKYFPCDQSIVLSEVNGLVHTLTLFCKQFATTKFGDKVYIHTLNTGNNNWATFLGCEQKINYFVSPNLLKPNAANSHYLVVDGNQKTHKLNLKRLKVNALTRFIGDYFYIGDRVFGFLTFSNVKWLYPALYNWIYVLMLCWNHARQPNKIKYYIPRAVLFDHILKDVLFEMACKF